jgi:hypothetical protein
MNVACAQCLPRRSAAASANHWPADADPLGNLKNRQALGRQQNDLPPLNMLHRTALYPQ